MVISRRTYEEKGGGGGREGEEMIETEKKNEKFFQPNPNSYAYHNVNFTGK